MHIEVDPCPFCEQVLDVLARKAKEELGPYDDKEYWTRRQLEKIAERLVNEIVESA